MIYVLWNIAKREANSAYEIRRRIASCNSLEVTRSRRLIGDSTRVLWSPVMSEQAATRMDPGLSHPFQIISAAF
jgi:hypothetical protein